MKIYFKIGPKLHPKTANLFTHFNNQHVLDVDNKEFFDKLIKKEPDIDKWNYPLYLQHGLELVEAEGIKNPRLVAVNISYRDVGNYVLSLQEKEDNKGCAIV